MHELSLAQAIVAIAEGHADGRRIVRVDARVGALRQVVPDALIFAFELLTDGAELVVHEVPARVACACGATSAVHAFPLACATCGSLDVDVVAGEELLVEAIEVEEVEVVGSK